MTSILSNNVFGQTSYKFVYTFKLFQLGVYVLCTSDWNEIFALPFYNFN